MTHQINATPESPLSRRQKVDYVKQWVSTKDQVLEIGPSISPVIKRKEGYQVKYIETSGTASMRERAKSKGKNPDDIDEIDFILDRKLTLKQNVNGEEFDVVTSSHVIEHIPDLIQHFSDIDSVLRHRGYYIAIIPDRNFCFDCLKSPTSLGQVIEAHIGDPISKRVANLVDEWRYGSRPEGHGMGGWTFAKTSDPLEFKFPDWPSKVADLVQKPCNKAKNWYGHQWYFDPVTFPSIFADLIDIGMLKLDLKAILPTYNMDFVAVMQKQGNVSAEAARQVGKTVESSYEKPNY